MCAPLNQVFFLTSALCVSNVCDFSPSGIGAVYSRFVSFKDKLAFERHMNFVPILKYSTYVDKNGISRMSYTVSSHSVVEYFSFRGSRLETLFGYYETTFDKYYYEKDYDLDENNRVVTKFKFQTLSLDYGFSAPVGDLERSVTEDEVPDEFQRITINDLIMIRKFMLLFDKEMKTTKNSRMTLYSMKPSDDGYFAYYSEKHPPQDIFLSVLNQTDINNVTTITGKYECGYERQNFIIEDDTVIQDGPITSGALSH